MKNNICLRWLSLLLVAMTLLTLLSCDGQTDREYRHALPDCYYSSRVVNPKELFLKGWPETIRSVYQTEEELLIENEDKLNLISTYTLPDGSFGRLDTYIYSTGTETETEDEKKHIFLTEYDPETELMNFTELFLQLGGERIGIRSGGTFLGRLEDGTIVAIEDQPRFDANGESIVRLPKVEYPHNFRYLTTYTSDGSLTSSTLLYDIDNRLDRADSLTMSFMLPDGTLYLFMNSYNEEWYSTEAYIASIDVRTAELTGYWLLRDCCADLASGLVDFVDLQCDMNGRPYAVFQRKDTRKYEICPLEALLKAADGQEAERLALRSNFGGSLVAISDTAVYFSNDLGIYREKRNAEEENPDEMLFYWLDVDLSGTTNPYGNNIDKIHMRSEDQILLIYTDNYSMESSLIYIDRSDTPVETDKTLLTIAYDGDISYSNRANALSNFLNLASNFNRSSDRYRIRLMAYTASGTSSANDQLKLDLVSGRVPDMILFGGSITSEPFVRMEEFVDLYQFMDADDTYTRDAFLPCALTPFETAKGQLPYLPVNFTLHTMMGLSTATGGKTAWTLDDFENALNNLGENQYLLKLDGAENPQLALLESILPAVVDQYVDYEKKKCDFNGDFRRLLELCKDAPVMAVDGCLTPGAYSSGSVLLMDYEITILDKFLQQRVSMAGENPIQCVGAPRSDGAAYGTAISADLQLSILKASEHPEAGWEFIKYYLDGCVEQWETFRDRPWTLYTANGFAPTVSCMEKMFDVLHQTEFFYKFVPVELANGEDGVSVNSIVYFGPLHAEWKDKYKNTRDYFAEAEGLTSSFAFPESDEAMLRSLFANCTVVWSRDDAVLDILYEEASAYFVGAKSLDDTIRLMENRVKTRINE